MSVGREVLEELRVELPVARGLYMVGLMEKGFDDVGVRALAVERFIRAERRRTQGCDVSDSFGIEVQAPQARPT